MHFTINDLALRLTRLDFVNELHTVAGSITITTDDQPDADAVRARLRGNTQETYRLHCERTQATTRATTDHHTALLHLAGLCTTYRDHAVVGYVGDRPAVILPPGHLHQVLPR